jgi:DNA topoisomerase IA
MLEAREPLGDEVMSIDDHPPIHPVRLVSANLLSTQEWQLYSLVCCHFLAQLAGDAVADEKCVTVDMGGEKFDLK